MCVLDFMGSPHGTNTAIYADIWHCIMIDQPVALIWTSHHQRDVFSRGGSSSHQPPAAANAVEAKR